MFGATDRNKALYIGELFKRVFDVQLPVYFPYGTHEYYEADRYSDVKLIEKETSELTSWMGTPVINSFMLKGGSYKIYDTDGQIIDITINEFVMPYATLVDFEQNKNLTQTRVVGNYGTIKEMYGFDDWRISIRGFCLNDNSRQQQKLAKEQMWALDSWSSLASSIEVEGELFNNKGINNIAICDLKIRAVQGKPDVVSYEISAISDTAIELIDL